MKHPICDGPWPPPPGRIQKEDTRVVHATCCTELTACQVCSHQLVVELDETLQLVASGYGSKYVKIQPPDNRRF